MIPASRKFPLRREFLSFRSRAKKVALPHSVVYHLSSSLSPRLAVVVPKRVSGLATTRNWLRRLTYYTLWREVKDKNLDLVIVYKPLHLTKSPVTKAQIVSELSTLPIIHHP